MKEEIKNILSLAINYDTLSKEYIDILFEKFSSKFEHIYIVSENEVTNKYNAKIVSNLKSVILETKWLLILNENEFPSIQFIDNFAEEVSLVNEEKKIIRLPIVIYSSLEDKIIDILEPLPRIFRSNPQSLKSSGNYEVELDRIPLIKIL